MSSITCRIVFLNQILVYISAWYSCLTHSFIFESIILIRSLISFTCLVFFLNSLSCLIIWNCLIILKNISLAFVVIIIDMTLTSQHIQNWWNLFLTVNLLLATCLLSFHAPTTLFYITICLFTKNGTSVSYFLS